jgi:hypothetical protein
MIEKIVIGLATIFPYVEFDVDIETFGDGSQKYKIWVNNLNFYLEDQLFKKICRGYHNKYPKIKWFAYYQPECGKKLTDNEKQ